VKNLSFLRAGLAAVWLAGCLPYPEAVKRGRTPLGPSDPTKQVLSASEKSVPSQVLVKIPTKDAPRLLREYRSRRLPSERVKIVCALAYVGGDAAVAALTNSLTVEFRGQRLNLDEEVALHSCLFALGMLGQDNDRAYEFLKAACRPETWRRIRKWGSTERHRTSSDLNCGLAAFSIQALGLTGREEVWEMLRKWREVNYGYTYPEKAGGTYHFDSAMRVSLTYLEFFKKLGKAAFREQVWSARFREFEEEFKQTPTGMDWWRWIYPPEKRPWMWKDGKPQ